MKVLIVDDTNTDRLLLKLYLGKLGYQVVEAQNGQEAIEQYSLHSHDLDLILIDVQMPQMNGFEAVKAIRDIQEREKQEWFPIIFLSASANDNDVEQGIWAGGDDYLIKPISQKILMAKMLAMRRISEMRRRLVDMNEKLEKVASTDFLTGAISRRAFDSALDNEMQTKQKPDCGLVFALLDLDKFKKVNDTFGHAAGDEVLVEVVARIKRQLREVDTIARLGGEEFGVILSNVDRGNASEIFERCRLSVEEEPIAHGDMLISVTVSIGFILYSDQDKMELFKHADRALYEAKNSGRNRVIEYQESFC